MFGLWTRTVRRRRRRLRRRSRRQRGSGPNPYFKVKYGDTEVIGQTLPKNITQAIPTVELSPNLDQSYFYTLVMDDPDAPTVKPFMHWMVINFRGSDFSSGHPVYEYEGPDPPSGSHRYIFTLYKQLLGQAPPPQKQDRGTYDKSKFIAAQQLQPVGQPVYFYVEGS